MTEKNTHTFRSVSRIAICFFFSLFQLFWAFFSHNIKKQKIGNKNVCTVIRTVSRKKICIENIALYLLAVLGQHMLLGDKEFLQASSFPSEVVECYLVIFLGVTWRWVSLKRTDIWKCIICLFVKRRPCCVVTPSCWCKFLLCGSLYPVLYEAVSDSPQGTREKLNSSVVPAQLETLGFSYGNLSISSCPWYDETLFHAFTLQRRNKKKWHLYI